MCSCIKVNIRYRASQNNKTILYASTFKQYAYFHLVLLLLSSFQFCFLFSTFISSGSKQFTKYRCMHTTRIYSYNISSQCMDTVHVLLLLNCYHIHSLILTTGNTRENRTFSSTISNPDIIRCSFLLHKDTYLFLFSSGFFHLYRRKLS